MSLAVAVQIARSADDVWQRLTDFAGWPEWNPACTTARIDGPIEPGSRVHLTLRHPTGREFLTQPRLSEVAGPRRLVWEVRAMGVRSPTIITLDDHEGETLVQLTSSSEGALGFAYRLMFAEKAQAQMWSGALTGLARSFSTNTETE